MKKKSIELKELRGLKVQEIKDIQKVADSENRGLNEQESTDVDKLIADSEELKTQIQRAEKLEAIEAEEIVARSANAGGTPAKENGAEEKREYSLAKALLEQRDKNLSGLELEMHQEAQNEARYSANTSISGVGVPSFMMEERADISETSSGIKPTEVGAFVEAVRENSVHGKVLPSSSILNGLTGDYKIPLVTKQSLAWASAENSAATDGGQNFSSKTLTPSRVTGFVNISEQMLIQNGQGVMTSVMTDLGREFGNVVDEGLISTATVTNAPTSIAATAGVGTFTEAAYSANASVLADTITAIQTLATNEGLSGSLAYVAATNLMSELYKSAQVASTLPAMTGQLGSGMNVNGYGMHFTNTATSSAGVSGDFLFGDWSNVKLGYFGGMDLMLDPFSKSLNNQIRLVVHRHLDFKLLQGARFVKATSVIA